MDADHHQRVSDLFAEVMGLDPAARRDRLDAACADDARLRADVEELLRFHDQAQSAKAAGSGRAIGIATGSMNVGDLFDPTGGLSPRGGFEVGPDLGSALASTARYTIQRVLGEGGMGTVYLAEQDRPRRTVALKVMRSTVAGAARMRKRFELEANVLGRLEHPGIARIYDAGVATITTADGSATVPYFAMEYVDGLTLTRFCEERRLGTRERMALMAQIAEAVAVAHRHGIVHRDLKPANILVDAKGQVKVLDFGVARATEGGFADGVTTLQTDVGQLIGTLGYMSPEQVSGDSSRIGVRSDVYALGAIAYELLAGQPLVDARTKSVAEVARVIQDEEPRTLSSYGKVFRGDLETIVAKAIEKDPHRRYADAAEFAADVHRYLRDEPIVARPATTLYQIGKFARRNRVLVGGVAATMVVLALGLVGTSIGMLQAIESQARADNRFGQLRKLAKSFIYDFHDAIAELPGSLEARKKLVTTALEYLDGLATEQSDDVDLQNELSEAYLRIGQVQGYGSKSNLGDREGAMVSFEKALAIRVEALERHPDSSKTLDGICIIRNHIANLKLSSRKLDEARAEFQRVLEDRKRLAAMLPDDDRMRRAVGVTHQWLGNTYRELAAEVSQPEAGADGAKATAMLDKAVEHYREFLAVVLSLEGRGDPMNPRDIAVAHEKLGDVLVDRREYDAAIAEYAKSLGRREKRYAENPNNAEARTDLVASNGKVGNSLLELGKLTESRGYLDRSYELALAADAEQPGDVLARTNRIISEYRIGRLYAALAEEAHKAGKPVEEQQALMKKGIEVGEGGLARLRELDAAGKLDQTKKGWIELFQQSLDEVKATEARLRASW